MSRKLALGIVLGCLLGGGLVWGFHWADEVAAFDRGRAQGLADCQKPSKLEKAAKWLAE